MTTSPLKWAGGKRWIVPMLKEYYQAAIRTDRDIRLVEPFCGGLSVTLGLEPIRALAGDKLVPLVNFWCHVKAGLGFNIDKWQRTEIEYYRVRERFNKISETKSEESAILFYYLNRAGFNGLCRFNAKGGFNVPWGGGKTNKLIPLGDYRTALARVEFTCRDFRSTLARCSANDFIYADPPYDTEFTAYGPGGFSWGDQRDLVRILADAPCSVVISNQATERIVKCCLDSGFALHYRDVRRCIRSYTTKGGKTADRKAREIVAINAKLQKML